MRVSLRAVLAGAAAVLAVGATASAMAQDSQVHVLTVQLPGGGVEQIRYVGDVPPRLVLVPAIPVAAPMMAQDPFAMMARLSALMNQQAAVMLRQADAMAGAPTGLQPGTSGYSFVSSTSGAGVCTRSVRITYNGGDAAPKMVSSTSGDCGPDHGGPPPAGVNMPAPVAHPVPGTIEARATGQTPGEEPAPQIAWNR